MVGNGGTEAHVEINDHGLVVKTGAGGASLVILTRTGITPPVASLKGRCLRTDSLLDVVKYEYWILTSQDGSDFS